MTDVRRWLRSVPGQFAVFGASFAAAGAIATAIVCLRGPVFERYVRETYPTPDGYAVEAGRVLADPRSPPEAVAATGRELAERIARAAEAGQPTAGRARDLEGLYAIWAAGPADDGGKWLARRLTDLQPDWVFARLRTTLVAGSPAQQARALDWLGVLAQDGRYPERVGELAGYTRRKAARRGDVELQNQADAVLSRGHPRDGGP